MVDRPVVRSCGRSIDQQAELRDLPTWDSARHRADPEPDVSPFRSHRAASICPVDAIVKSDGIDCL